LDSRTADAANVIDDNSARARLGRAGRIVRLARSVDRRHNAKVDYPALRKLLARSRMAR